MLRQAQHERKVLVACVGNVLRRDDGFGVAVAAQLAHAGVPPHVDLIETGIGGMSIVQQLMDGYETLIVVDAVDRGAEPGSVFVLQPDVPDARAMPTDEWQALFSNLHLAEPYRVFVLAQSLGVLPPRVMLVGCQPLDTESYGETLSPPVATAVYLAAERVQQLVRTFVPSGVR